MTGGRRAAARFAFAIALLGFVACDGIFGPRHDGGSSLTKCDSLASPSTLGIVLKATSAIRVGNSSQFVALLLEGPAYYDPNTVPIPVIWASSDPTVVSVTSSGAATALKPGTSTVTVSACNVRQTIVVTAQTAGFAVLPIGDGFKGTALNDSGVVAGYTQSANLGGNPPKYFLWNGGTFVDLGDCAPISLNNLNQAVCGYSVLYKAPRIWENGAAAERDTFAAFGGQINDSGYVAGTLHSKRALWRGRGVIDSSSAVCSPGPITKQAHTGGSDFSQLYQKACRVTAVGFEALGGSRYASVVAMNDADDAVGYREWWPLRGQVAALWRASSNAAEDFVSVSPYKNDVATVATDVNNSLEVVGSGSQGAFIWRNGKLALLSALVNDASWIFTDAARINEKGQILATGVRNGTTSLVLLVPTP